MYTFRLTVVFFYIIIQCMAGTVGAQGIYNADSGEFENPYYGDDRIPGIIDMLYWKFSYHVIQKPLLFDRYEYSYIAPEYVNLPVRFHSGMMTWVGHSTFVIQVDGINIVTDPVWSDRVGPLGGIIGHQRQAPPGVPWEKLPHIDVVVISHNHYDHLDRPTIERLEESFQPLYLVPAGVGGILQDWGIDSVLEFHWWDSIEYAGVEFIATPAKHKSQRSLGDRNSTLWSGWVIRAAQATLYFAGDTGYFSGFNEIRDRVGAIDVAMLPIGAYEPRWYNRAYHLDPAEALHAFRDLGARYLAAMHWGTFDQSEEKRGEPPQELMYHAEDRDIDPDSIWIFAFGESRAVPPREDKELPAYTLESR
jgi:N-acyl-phosphatidylethanolamine-hydrolysing phospholipase D